MDDIFYQVFAEEFMKTIGNKNFSKFSIFGKNVNIVNLSKSTKTESKQNSKNSKNLDYDITTIYKYFENI
jgi:hypothetical protein